MLLLYMLLFLPIFVAVQGSQSMKTLDREMLRNDSRVSLDWIGESFLNTIDTFFPISKSCNDVEGTNNNNYLQFNIVQKNSIYFQILHVWCLIEKKKFKFYFILFFYYNKVLYK